MFDELKCKRGHLRCDSTTFYKRSNGKQYPRCIKCFKQAARLKYRKNDSFREAELVRSKNYYHTKVKHGQKVTGSSNET